MEETTKVGTAIYPIKHNRDLYWDFVRGFAMLCVVVGHAGFKNTNHLYLFIYTFHMPLFMLVSGWFFFYSLQRHSVRDIVIGKSRQLLLPVLVLGLLFFVFSGNYTVVNLNIILTRNLWFLLALYYAVILTLIIEQLPQKRMKYAAYTLAIIAFHLIPDYLYSTGAKFLYPFFVGGFYFNKNKEKCLALYSKYKPAIISVLIVVFLLLFIHFDYNDTFYRSSVYLFSGKDAPVNLLIESIYRCAIGFTAVVFLLGLLYELYKRFPSSKIIFWLSELGKVTLPFYCIHVYTNYFIFILGLQKYILPYIFGTTLVCYLLSVSWNRISRFVKKEKYAR